MSSERISAGFSMQVSQTSKVNLVSDCILSHPIKYPSVLLIKPSIAAKEREERHGKRFVMDGSRMTVAQKSIPNMGSCGVH